MNAILERSPETTVTPTHGDPIYTHIVAETEDMTAMEAVMQARVYGTPVTALCGHTWVPMRDAKQFPLCSKCVAIREEHRPDQDPNEIPS